MSQRFADSIFVRGRQTPSRLRRPPRFMPASEPLEGRSLLSHGGNVIEVNADPADADAFHTITAGVAAAKPGDTIQVAPGTYNESVTVAKRGITIVGKPTDSDDPRNGPTVVTPPANLAGFDVEANDVTISGITVQGATNAPGIELGRTVSGSQIVNDVLKNNTFGLYLNSDGKHQTVVANDSFISNNAPGSSSGNGIYSDQGASNVLIKNNDFTGQDNAAILFAGGPASQSKLTIVGNRMVNDSAIILVNTTHSVIADNTNIGSNGYAVFFGGGVSDVAVTGNTLRNGAYSGILIDVRPDIFNLSADPAASQNHDISISDNTVTRFQYDGVTVAGGAYKVSIRHNTINNNARNGVTFAAGAVNGLGVYKSSITDNTVNFNGNDGVALAGKAHDNTVSGNTINHNGTASAPGGGLTGSNDGLYVGSGEYQNTFRDNSLHGNVAYDIVDNSHGSGTAGTANTYVHNDADKTFPPALAQDDDKGHGHGGHDGHGHDDEGHGHGHDDDDDGDQGHDD